MRKKGAAKSILTRISGVTSQHLPQNNTSSSGNNNKTNKKKSHPQNMFPRIFQTLRLDYILWDGDFCLFSIEPELFA